MKSKLFKRLISAASAATLAITSMGMVNISAQAAEPKEIEVNRVYMANELFEVNNLNIGNNTLLTTDSSKESFYNNDLGAPFGGFDTLTAANYPKYMYGNSLTADLKCNLSATSNYVFNLMVVEYNNRYVDVYLDGEQLLKGSELSGVTKIGKVVNDNRSLSIIQLPVKVETSGEHTITMKSPNGVNVVGVLAANLVKNPDPVVFDGTQVYPAGKFVNGIDNVDRYSYTMQGGMDDLVYDSFAVAGTDTVKSEYTNGFKNFIGHGTVTQITGLNMPAGTYRVYYVGYNNSGDFYAELGGTKVKWKEKCDFAVAGTKKLEMYTFDITLGEEVKNTSLVFSRDDYWLPDMYFAAITNENKLYSVSGKVSGADTALTGAKLVFTSARGKSYTANIAADGSFSASLPKASYSVSLDGNIYYKTVDGQTLTADADKSDVDIKLEKEAAKKVKVTLVNAPKDDISVKITNEAGEEQTVNISKAGADILLAPGEYSFTTTDGTLSEMSKTKLTVSDADTYKVLYFPEEIKKASGYTVTVGDNGEYKTISDALKGIAMLGTPTKDNRATVVLEGGKMYREQVVVDIPYVTFTSPAENPATISWYYGIGNTYYSLDEKGRYNKDRAITKTGKLMINPAAWGSTIISNKAGLKFENIKLENSFNQYYTDEEFADGVEPNGQPNCGQNDRVQLKADGIAADTRKATERACALYSQGKECEFYNCTIISSQDTIGTGGTMYFKDCTLIGNTDYICSGGQAVFDDCELLFGGYSDTAIGGALTAAHTGDGESYVFRNCTIGNYQNEEGTRKHGTHTYGRDWGGEKSSVYFFNTAIADDVSIKGWGDMGGAVNSGKADLHVYNFDNPDQYSLAGAKEDNINKLLTFEEAKAVYEGVGERLGFTPERLLNAQTSATEKAQDEESGKYVYGVLTQIATGENSGVSEISWTVRTADGAKTLKTSELTDKTNDYLGKDKVSVSGGIVCDYLFLFETANEYDYEVMSVAE